MLEFPERMKRSPFSHELLSYLPKATRLVTPVWLNRFRRILVRWEKRADTYLAMLHLACGLITWRAANWGRLAE